jgi:ubiquitin C-terminal hydrolase
MPNLLIIALSRFSYDPINNIKRKVCDRVRMENYLIFGNLTSTKKQDNYKLIAFINHMGKNAESGHYQAYIRHPRQDNKWLNFDDDFVT